MTYHESRDSQGTTELSRDVTDAGRVTGQARALIERETGQPVVSPHNAKDLKNLPEKKKKQEDSLSARGQYSERSLGFDCGYRSALSMLSLHVSSLFAYLFSKKTP